MPSNSFSDVLQFEFIQATGMGLIEEELVCGNDIWFALNVKMCLCNCKHFAI